VSRDALACAGEQALALKSVWYPNDPFTGIGKLSPVRDFTIGVVSSYCVSAWTTWVDCLINELPLAASKWRARAASVPVCRRVHSRSQQWATGRDRGADAGADGRTSRT